jgi:hypothetical protein
MWRYISLPCLVAWIGGKPAKGGPLTLRQHHRMLPTVGWKEGRFMQYGNPVPDLICGRCKKKLDMAVLKEAVY